LQETAEGNVARRTVSLSREVAAAIQAEADRMQRPFSWIVQQALVRWNKLEEQEKTKAL
jgi:hypothetical protein